MYRHVLVSTDGSRLSAKAVREALMIATVCGARLSAVFVMPDFHAFVAEHYQVPPAMAAPVERKFRQEAAVAAERILEAVRAEAIMAGVDCDGVALTDDAPWRAIVGHARRSGCDLIVMASHGRRGLKGLLLGSETSKVLTHTGISVLVVR